MRPSPWLHLALLVVVATALLVATALPPDGARAAAWPLVIAVAGGLAVLLPVLAGLAVGVVPPAPRGRRTAIAIVVAVTGLMLACDTLAGRPPVAQRAGTPEPGLVAGAIALGRGTLRGAGTVATSYRPDHPRWLALQAITRGGLLLLPGALVGLVLGVGAWLARAVTFRTLRDERIARWVIAWILVPAAATLVVGWSTGYAYRILFEGAPLWLPLVPYVPALMLGAVGWHAAGGGVADHGGAARARTVAAVDT